MTETNKYKQEARELLPCPFCGGPAEKRLTDGPKRGFIGCFTCMIGLPFNVPYGNVEVAAWNSRASVAAVEGDAQDVYTVLYEAVKAYVEHGHGAVAVINGIQVQEWSADGPRSFSVAVRCEGVPPEFAKPPALPNDKQKQEAREVRLPFPCGCLDAHTGGGMTVKEHACETHRAIASALSVRDAEIERLRGWQEGLAATMVTWSAQRLSRDTEIREVLEGLRGAQGNPRCWCNPKFPNVPGCHTFQCQAASALYAKLQLGESNE